MTKFKVDTIAISNVISDIRFESEKYQLAVDNFFKEIENLSNYWNGPDADKFILGTLRKKKDLDKLKLIFADYVYVLQKLVIKIDSYDYFQG